jgi:hypothetical protein
LLLGAVSLLGFLLTRTLGRRREGEGPHSPLPCMRGSAPTYFVSRWVFLRLLGVVYLAAFLSLRGQVNGLVKVRWFALARQGTLVKSDPCPSI